MYIYISDNYQIISDRFKPPNLSNYSTGLLKKKLFSLGFRAGSRVAPISQQIWDAETLPNLE